MPMDRARYPDDWEKISLAIRERSGGCCEFCGAEAGQPHPMSGKKVVLTVAHLDHNEANCDPANLRALCQRCHLRYDLQQHMANAALTRRRKRIKAGQLSLWDDPAIGFQGGD